MKENMLDVLMYLFEHYFEDETALNPDQELLKIKLLEAGFPQDEISKAFDWLEGLINQRETATIQIASKTHSFRQYTPEETMKLDTECRGFLLFLEQIDVLTTVTREQVIERAVALEMDELDLDRLKWIILMVLFNQPGEQASLLWIEDVVFEDLETRLH